MSDTTTHSEDLHGPAESSRSVVARNPLDVPVSLTRDDVRAIVRDEIGMDADLLRESLGVLKRGETTFKGNDSSEELGNHDRNYDRLARAFIESLEGATAQLVGHRKFGRDLGVAHGVDRTHNSSPSVVDAGAHTLGEGEVAGAETAAPATNAGVDLVLIVLADQLREALMLRNEAGRADDKARLAHTVATREFEYAQQAVAVAEQEIRKHVTGGAE